MFDSSRYMFLRFDLPQFFKAETIGLRLTVLSKVKLVVELLGQMSVATLTKDCALGVNLHTTLKVLLKRK